MSSDIGPRIRAARQAAGLTQSDLAAATRISQNQLSRYERGLVEIPAVRLGTIALALGVSIAVLDTRLLRSSSAPCPADTSRPPAVPAPLVPLCRHWADLTAADRRLILAVATLVLARHGLTGASRP